MRIIDNFFALSNTKKIFIMAILLWAQFTIQYKFFTFNQKGEYSYIKQICHQQQAKLFLVTNEINNLKNKLNQLKNIKPSITLHHENNTDNTSQILHILKKYNLDIYKIDSCRIKNGTNQYKVSAAGNFMNFLELLRDCCQHSVLIKNFIIQKSTHPSKLLFQMDIIMA